MTEQSNTNEEKGDSNVNSSPTSETKSLINPAGDPWSAAVPQSNIGGQSSSKKPCNEGSESKPVFVRVIEDDAPSTFESKTIFWGRIGIFLAIATFVVGVLTLIAFYCQLKVMQTQLQDAESDGRTASRHARQQIRALESQVSTIQIQMRQDQRPWVSFKMNWPKIKNPAGESFDVLQFTDDKPVTIPLEFSNTGKTAARNVEAKMFVEIVKKEKSPQLESTKIPKYRFSSGILFPNSPADTWAIRQKAKPGTNGVDDLLKHSEREDMEAHRAYIAVYGQITYDDIFNTHHWTKFCMWVAFPSPELLSYNAKTCADYNNVDNN
jgi:hypothetical protein